jgi:hypothetical protein
MTNPLSTSAPPASAPPGATAQAEAALQPKAHGWCRNCDTALLGPYCSHCGQRNSEYAVSLRVLAQDFADEYLSFDSRLFRTVLNLFFRPGFLTRQYLIGRRERYVRPLRLYIVASLLFFLALSFAQPLGGLIESDPGEEMSIAEMIGFLGESETRQPPGAEGASPAAEAEPPSVPISNMPPVVGVGPWQIDVGARAERLGGMTFAGLMSTFRESFERYLPRMMFLLLPLFALLLKLLYVRRNWFYAEHFIFALHVHGFFFALFLLLLVVPSRFVPDGLLEIWGLLYLFFAMRHVYRQSWLKTGVKYLMLTATYAVALLMTFAGLVVATLLLV